MQSFGGGRAGEGIAFPPDVRTHMDVCIKLMLFLHLYMSSYIAPMSTQHVHIYICMYIEGGVTARLRSCECLRAYPLALLVRNHRTRALATRNLKKRLPEPHSQSHDRRVTNNSPRRPARWDRERTHHLKQELAKRTSLPRIPLTQRLTLGDLASFPIRFGSSRGPRL